MFINTMATEITDMIEKSTEDHRRREVDTDNDENSNKNNKNDDQHVSLYSHKVFLSKEYILNDNDVICGRGRTCFNHSGNQRFRDFVAKQLKRYMDAKTKTDKTVVINDIIQHIRSTTPTVGGGFVKFDKATNKYYEVGDFLAREKTSQAFRDILHEQYKSSNAKKRYKRKVLREEKGGLRGDDDDVASEEHSREKCQEVLSKKKYDFESNSQTISSQYNDNKPRRVSSSTDSYIPDPSLLLLSDASEATKIDIHGNKLPHTIPSSVDSTKVVKDTANTHDMILKKTTLSSPQLPVLPPLQQAAPTTIWWETNTGDKTTISSNLATRNHNKRDPIDPITSSTNNNNCNERVMAYQRQQIQQQLRDLKASSLSTILNHNNHNNNPIVEDWMMIPTRSVSRMDFNSMNSIDIHDIMQRDYSERRK